MARAKELYPDRPVIVEVENYEEFCEAVKCPVDRVMLDNFSASELQQVQALEPKVAIEVPGNITTAEIGSCRAAGPVAASSGGLTKHVRAVDFSMRIQS